MPAGSRAQRVSAVFNTKETWQSTAFSHSFRVRRGSPLLNAQRWPYVPLTTRLRSVSVKSGDASPQFADSVIHLRREHQWLTQLLR